MQVLAKQVHSAVKSGKEVISIPSLPSEAPSSSRMASPQEGSFGKNVESPVLGISWDLPLEMAQKMI